MATTPASTADTRMRSTHGTHVAKFRAFLRSAPQTITREFINANLLNTGKGFANNTDINNRITHATTMGDIVSLGRGNGYRNALSEAAVNPPAKHINGGAVHVSPESAPLAEIVDEAADLAKDALTDQSITRTQLLSHLLLLTSVFKALQPSHS